MDIKTGFKKKITFEKKVDRYVASSIEGSLNIHFESECDDLEEIYLSENERMDLEDNLKVLPPRGVRKKMVSYGGRYGSMISVSENLHWNLELLKRSMNYLFKDSATHSVPGILSDIHRVYFSKSLLRGKKLFGSEETPYFKGMDDKIDEARLFLTRVFRNKIDIDLADVGSQIDLSEYYIPELSYHELSAFRYLYLAILEPNLLNTREITILFATFLDQDQDELGHPRGESLKDLFMALEVDTSKIIDKCKKRVTLLEKEINIEPDDPRREQNMGMELRKKYNMHDRALIYQSIAINKSDKNFIHTSVERFYLYKKLIANSGKVMSANQ